MLFFPSPQHQPRVIHPCNPHTSFHCLSTRTHTHTHTQSHTRTTTATTTKWKPRVGGGRAYLWRQSWFRAPAVPRPLACSRPRRLRHSSSQKRTKTSTIKVEIMIVARATIHTRAAAPPQQLSRHPDVPRSSPAHRRLPQLGGEGGGPACGSRRSLLRHLGPKHWPRCRRT